MTDPTRDLPGLPPERIHELAQQHTTAAVARDAKVAPWRRQWPALVVAVCVLALAAFAFLGWLQARESHHDVVRLQTQVKQLGGVPIAGPQGSPGAAGPGPSVSQVAQAVSAYCATSTCGSPPSTAQVASAVRDYCDARGQCRGTPGTPGTTGAAGRTGATGPGPSAVQVAAAVATYCAAHDSCTGAQGSTGPQGSPGPSGPAGPQGPAGRTPATLTFQVGVVTYRCTRQDGTVANPSYTCAPDLPLPTPSRS